MNAHCQPHVSVIQGTMSGVTSAPMFVPELKMPVANARSFFGNHSAMALIAAGKLPPRRGRAGSARGEAGGRAGQHHETEAGRGVEEDRREHAGEVVRARMRHRGDAPQHDGDRVAAAHADAVHDPAGGEQTDRVGELEGEDDRGVVAFGPSELALERGLEDADDLAIDVVDGRREEQQRADHPAITADGRADGYSSRRCSNGRTVRRVPHVPPWSAVTIDSRRWRGSRRRRRGFRR